MVLLALGAWMLSSLTSQSGFVMNSATPRGSKVAMRGFKDDFYAWKETLSSEDQALLLKQAQNASWQLSVFGCPKWHSALVQTLHVFQAHVYGLLMFSREFHPSKYSMMVPTECCFFFKLPLLSIRFQNTFVTYAYDVVIFSKECKNWRNSAFSHCWLGMAT